MLAAGVRVETLARATDSSKRALGEAGAAATAAEAALRADVVWAEDEAVAAGPAVSSAEETAEPSRRHSRVVPLPWNFNSGVRPWRRASDRHCFLFYFV